MESSHEAELISLLRTLRQTRSYATDPVSDEALAQILEVARWTGSGGNQQPWRLVVVRDADLRRMIAATKPGMDWVADAPIVIGVVTAGKTADSSRFDAGRLVERMMLAARAQGLVAAVVSFGPPDSEPAVAARSLLNVPDDLWITHAVAIGHAGPADKDPGSAKSGRKPLDEIVVQERFPEN